ncbi:TPA: hypothetical protein DCZ39_07530 [Patescibacteria group bacterium]|nr:hypothetical protein [Candidatus Gracilibacteria bacterium]
MPTDKMTITYIDQKTYETSRKAAEKIETNRVSKETIKAPEIKNIFVLPTHISSVFVENTEKALSVFDDYKKTLYRDFMESILEP